MGFFGTNLYEGDRWSVYEPERVPDAVEPWILVDIHDSDITTVRYSPPGRGTGLAYLGFTPRAYFEDPEASRPTDVAREATGLTDWWALHGQARQGSREAKEEELRGYLAADDDPCDEDDEDDENLDDAEVFVEVKTARLLAALDLSLPADLPS